MIDAHTDRQHYNVTLAALIVGALAYALQQTMILPAIPAIERDLNTTTTWVTWVLTGFLLVSAVATPLLAKLGDQYGKEHLLLVSLSVFFVGCVGAIFAPNIAALIAFRLLQGAGGAIFPLTFAIITDEFPRDRQTIGLGVVSSVFGAGGGLGLVLSGIMVDHLSWRWIFVIGSIAVAIGMLATFLYVPESPIKTPSRIDWPGALLLSVGLVALLLALSEGQDWGWDSARTIGLIVVALVIFLVWYHVERRVSHPMVDMRMMANRTVAVTNLTGLLAGFGMFGSFLLIPTFVETPRGLSPALSHLVHYGFGATATQAGLYLVPGALGGFFAGPLAGALARRAGAKIPLVIGMALTATGLLMFALWHTQVWQIVIAMLILSSGIPCAFAVMPKLLGDSVDPSETGVANGMNTVARTVGGVVGAQISAAILANQTIAHTSIPDESAFTVAFAIGAVTSACAAVVAIFATRKTVQPELSAQPMASAGE